MSVALSKQARGDQAEHSVAPLGLPEEEVAALRHGRELVIPHGLPLRPLGVESGCGAVAFRLGLSVPGPSGCRCLIIPASPRLHTPLIEPCLRISRTRLSD